ncbi:type I polyketide synthase [Actinocrispum wychmicini]|uniref:Enediyne polyketide synthase n=1 Tax=Actinocrispum wychmicini TaxID=1213861 RepID=A0A4R2JLB8_9PSEU|nr:type I polyketide synthase [Actinocrispum wychmicini]TCO59657.1 enediyne polyketide synthase [Actinocrispum wychmicini]
MSSPRIAVVGMACHYPDAHSPAELWHTVHTGRKAFRALPPGRLSPAYLGDRGDPDRTYVTHAGVLRDWEFDRARFHVPVNVHRAVDHTHWLALQTAAEAFADAGFPDADALPRDEVGVVLGNSLGGEFSRAAQLRVRWPFLAAAAAEALRRGDVSADRTATVLAELERAVKEPFPEPTDETLAGALANTIAGRICNHFDLHGGGYTVDGACSSSLLAVVHAARAVATGEWRFAVAGGVDLSIDPLELVGFARVGVLAVDQMRVYDADPTGFLPGEGCGVVILTTVDEADRRGLPVHAELLGWGIASDGAGGLTRPSVTGQLQAMRRAYRMAGIDPGATDLVEGHGTGTAVGDQAEIEALCQLRSAGGRPAALGSVKANIGHTKAAAGVAGLLKAVLAARASVLPPTSGCVDPHPLLQTPDCPLRTVIEPEPWTAPNRYAAVSALGFGGINTHIVIGNRTAASAAVPAPVFPAHHAIVLMGADSASQLADSLATHAPWFGRLSSAEMHDVAATTYGAAADSPVRCALVAANPTELGAAAVAAAARLADWDGSLTVATGFVLAAGPPPPVGLLFPGQAAPVRTELPSWAKHLAVPDMPATPKSTVDTSAAQPAILRQSLAGMAWLAALGCEPAAAAGHSLGEIAALVWSGALAPEAAMDFVAARGRLMADHGTPGTTMASLDASPATVTGLIRSTWVVIACQNGPRRTVVAGPVDEIDLVLTRARSAGIAATPLPVSHGFHSPAMEPAISPLRTLLAGVRFDRLQRPVLSTVTGHLLADDTDLADLLLTQLTAPVRFQDALAALSVRCGLLVEVGPGHTLSGLAADCAPGTPVVTLDCGGPPRAHALATAALVACGAGSAAVWFAGRGHRRLPPGTPMSFLDNPCETSNAAPRGVTPTAQPSPAVSDADPMRALRDRLATECDLPRSGITPATSMSRDLHLSSLRIIALITGVATELGRKAPSALPVFADATVGEIAEALAELDVTDDHTGAGPPGVREWVRAFTHRWVPWTPSGTAADLDWTVHAPHGHWLHQVLTRRPGHRTALAVFVPTEAGTSEVASALRAIAGHRPGVLLVVHHGHPAAAAVGRSAYAELPGCATTVLRVPAEARDLDTGLVTAAGYREFQAGADGSVTHPRTTPFPLVASADPPIAPGEVCLVTGGVTGITAHAAIALARRTGCTLVFVGRRPDTDPTVAERLAVIREHVDARYLSVDVTDQQAVPEVTAYGPVRGLLHGAAVNEPHPMSTVDDAGLARTVAPKADGLANLLSAVGDGLRLVVAFGSVIGRTGLTAQAEYCVANEWLRHRLTEWAADRPGCRAHCVEWSLWSEIGMGARMGAVDGLAATGVAAIPPDSAADALVTLLGTPDAPVTVTVSGRLPSTFTVAGPEVPLVRFLEDLPARTPGVETVAEATLSPADDPYLTEHSVDGVTVLPAVLGLEAMAQAVHATTGERTAWSFRDVNLPTPVVIGTSRRMRVATLADERGHSVEAVLTDDGDQFGSPRMTATIVPAPPLPPPGNPGTPPDRRGVHPYYGPLFFHSGRFARLREYEALSAFEVRAWLDTSDMDWFAGIHSRRLLLGDPGLLDASIHVLLACLPHRTVLPVGADSVTIWRRPSEVAFVRAREVRHTMTDYVFDVDLTDSHGTAVARWERLRLHAVGTRKWAVPLPARLVGPLLTRRLIECGVADGLAAWTSPDDTGGLRLEVRADHPVWTAVTAVDADPGAEPDRLSLALRDGTTDRLAESTARSAAIRKALASAGVTGEPRIRLVNGDLVVLGTGDGVQVACLLTTCEPANRALAIAVALPGI